MNCNRNQKEILTSVFYLLNKKNPNKVTITPIVVYNVDFCQFVLTTNNITVDTIKHKTNATTMPTTANMSQDGII